MGHEKNKNNALEGIIETFTTIWSRFQNFILSLLDELDHLNNSFMNLFALKFIHRKMIENWISFCLVF